MAAAATTFETLEFTSASPKPGVIEGGRIHEPVGLLQPVEEEAKPELMLEEGSQLSQKDRVLTEVNHLLRYRRSDGSYPDWVKKDVLLNLKTAATEAALPFKISENKSETAYEQGRRVTRWMGKTAIESAASGYEFHTSLEAYKRVDVEVDEAKYFERDLRPGVRKFMISPKMSARDASSDIAKAEHLCDDDSIRADWLEYDETTGKTYHVNQSILVRDIPLQAWVDMLADPDNAFGGRINVDDRDSALSVMKIHRELEMPIDSPIKTPVDLVREAAKFIKDSATKATVEGHIRLFDVSDQKQLDTIANAAANEWFAFEDQLAQSHTIGQLTDQLVSFVHNLDEFWSGEVRRIINFHKTLDGFKMCKEMAVVLESAKRKTLWSRLGAETGDQKIINQLDEKSLRDYQALNQKVQQATQDSWQYIQAQNEINRFFASQNIKTGGGCPGTAFDMFGQPIITTENVFTGNSADEDDRGPLTFNCPHCGYKNRRQAYRPLLSSCQFKKCGLSVEC